MEKIISFEGEFRFLSNFWPTQIFVEIEGVRSFRPDGLFKFPSVEHAFQAAKTDRVDEKILIQAAETPGKAKRLGRTVTLRPDWNEIKLQVMEDLVRQKFDHFALGLDLLNTGDAEIIEGNNWHDTFWGVCNCETHLGEGTNHLGKILMKIRAELRDK